MLFVTKCEGLLCGHDIERAQKQRHRPLTLSIRMFFSKTEKKRHTQPFSSVAIATCFRSLSRLRCVACASAATLSLEGKVPPWAEPAGSGGTGDKGDTEGSRAPCAPTASPSYLKTHWTLVHGTNPWAKVGSEKKK